MRRNDHFSRRLFLRLSALASISVAIPGCAKAPSKKDGNLVNRITEYLSPNEAPLKTITPENREKIIVIGAGVAGLAAAQELRAHGLVPIVLEARARIGGRVATNRSLGAPVELGATWIYGSEGNPLANFADQAGIRTAQADFDNSYLYDLNGQLLSDAERERIVYEADRIDESIGTLIDSLDDDTSVATLLQQLNSGNSALDIRVRDYFSAKDKLVSGTELDAVSVYYNEDDEGFDGPNLALPDGFDTIVKHLAQDLDIRFAEQVVKISRTKNGCRVQTAKRTYEASRVIVTLPLGVLKSGSVQFSPGLPPKKRAAIQSLQMGIVNKIALKFPKSFWPEDKGFFELLQSATSSGITNYLNLTSFSPQPILVGTIAADAARKLEDRTDAAIGESAYADLQKIFGKRIPKPQQVIASRWASDPLTKGSFSMVPVGGSSDAFQTISESVADRFFFAGEATSPDHRSTVHGAYLSGLREARRIIKLI